MRQIEQPVVLGFGWINSPFEPQTKHTSGGAIYFLKPGLYATTGRMQQMFKCCGDNDALTTAWDWTRAFSTHAVYTVINPQAHPTSAGFPSRSISR